MNIQGLSSQEVDERYKLGLFNKTLKTKTKSLQGIIVGNIFTVFNILILGIVAFLFYLFMETADKRLLMDSLGVMVVAVVNTLIAVIQEIRAMKALEKVSLMRQHNVFVIREGKESEIVREMIVKDEVIVLKRGDQVVADGPVLFSNQLELDESSITGESIHMAKNGDDQLYSGTFCVSGNGYYRAEKIGEDCHVSGIIKLAKKFKFNISPLQKKVNLIVKFLFAVAIVLVMWQLYTGAAFGISKIDFIRKLVTIIIALIPQGLVLMVSVTFALGVYRISKIGAIVEKLNSIEAFSGVQVICMDKTGTITQNDLSINEIIQLDYNLEGVSIQNLIGTYAANSSEKNETIRALLNLEYEENVTILGELPFSSERKYSILKLNIPTYSKENKSFIFGASEILLNFYNEPQKKLTIAEYLKTKNLLGSRNLLFGEIITDIPISELKNGLNGVNIKPIAIISINDRIRGDAKATIIKLKESDVDFKILSGDATNSIKSVLHQLDWHVNDSEYITGTELQELDEENLLKTVRSKTVFARLQPVQKLSIIKALRKQGIFTAMIGDGVNDIPALKESDVAISMDSGSNATKEVADIVLLKDKFTLLPEIFNEGNLIVNTCAALSKLFLTKNFLVVFFTLFSILFTWEFPLTPTRLSLFNIFAIGIPALIISSINKSISKNKYFFMEVISYVTVSAIVIVSFCYLGVYFTQKFYVVEENDKQMILLTLMILISFTNFYIVAHSSNFKKKKTYLAYVISFLFLYIFLIGTDFDFVFLDYLKSFYNVHYLEAHYWMVILPISIIASLILWVFQRIRQHIFKSVLV